jgi:hypothetical protein
MLAEKGKAHKKESIPAKMICDNKNSILFSGVFPPGQVQSPGGQRGTHIPAYGLGCSVYTLTDSLHWSTNTNWVGFLFMV